MKHRRLTLSIIAMISVLCGCATGSVKPDNCPTGTQKLEGCPPVGAVVDPKVEELRAERSFERDDLPAAFDPVAFARIADVPINQALAKFLDSTDEGAVRALGAKLWMIENAEYTVDVVYYILRDDLVGQALLGALCNAVQRGVDVRIMVDSLGSSTLRRKNLRALTSCALDGGFMRNADGEMTIYRARVQAGVFNATSTPFSNWNRRSHDKLIIKDGRFGDKAYTVTGGRNMSLDYYGFNADGSENTHSYRDAEILVRGAPGSSEAITIGNVVDVYYTLMFQFGDNKMLSMNSWTNPRSAYAKYRARFKDSLAALKALPVMRETLAGIDEYMTSGFFETSTRIAHNLQNVTNRHVVSQATENLASSPNSIIGLLKSVWTSEHKHVRIVSPYLFAAKYEDDGEVTVDEARDLLQWLDDHPDSKVTIVTNSVLTSDNFFTQSVIDFDLVPRLLMTPEIHKRWADSARSEDDPSFVASDEWQAMVNHPRLFIYETGTLDDVRFGGDYHHSKLHAKYIIGDDIGFVGTSNFDYRSRLYNSEMGFFIDDSELIENIARNTDYLITLSYRWGSPEWLEMRRRIRDWGGSKSYTVRHQRGIYKTIRNTGLVWLF